MMELFIVTEFKKLTLITLVVLALHAVFSAYLDYSQSEEIRELQNRIYILEKFTSALIDLV